MLLVGMVPTPGYDQFGFSEEQKEFVESQAKNIPLGRVGTPDEIAKSCCLSRFR